MLEIKSQLLGNMLLALWNLDLILSILGPTEGILTKNYSENLKTVFSSPYENYFKMATHKST